MTFEDLPITPIVILSIVAIAVSGAVALIRQHGGFGKALWGGDRREIGRVRLSLGDPRARSELTVYKVTPRRGEPFVAVGNSGGPSDFRGFGYAPCSSAEALELGRLFVAASERARLEAS